MNAHLIHPDTDELKEILERQWPEFQHEPGTIVNESAGGAPAATADGEAGEGDGEEGGEESQPLTRDDFESAFDSRFGELEGRMAQMIQGGYGEPGEYEGQSAEGGDEGLPDYEAIADEFNRQVSETGQVDPGTLEQFVEARAMESAQQIVEQVLPQAIQQAVGPLHDRFLQQDADAIEQKYPALQDPQTQQAVIQEALVRAQRMGLDQDFVRGNPQFVEETWLLRCAREGVPAVPAGGEDAALEGATAQTGGGDPEPTMTERLAQNWAGQSGGLFDGAFN